MESIRRQRADTCYKLHHPESESKEKKVSNGIKFWFLKHRENWMEEKPQKILHSYILYTNKIVAQILMLDSMLYRGALIRWGGFLIDLQMCGTNTSAVLYRV